MFHSDDPVGTFLDAAATFADLVARIEPSMWGAPGLGVWDVRALVGHTSRALLTVRTYLDRPARDEDVESPERYYALLAGGPGAVGDDVAERGRLAGEALGTDPAATVRGLLDEVTAKLTAVDRDSLITTIGGGMRVSSYLPTRTFELVVHGLDIADATGLSVGFSRPVLRLVTDLAGRIAVELDRAPTLLRALTGRRPLPETFSIVG